MTTTDTTMTRDEALAALAGALPADDEWGIETVAVPVAAIRAVVESRVVDIVFDGPPGAVAGRFVEAEDPATGASVNAGQWAERPDGTWALRMRLA